MTTMYQSTSTWFVSPAKLNLFLHVCGRFEDGYHDLQTYFQLLDVGDEIQVQPNLSGKILMKTDMPDVEPSQNLMVIAATELKKAAMTVLPSSVGQRLQLQHLGADIFIRKNMPMGGGIGGGSSNAATVLLVLNKFWNLQLPHEILMSIGKQIGADVPVFIKGMSGFAEGIGERLTPSISFLQSLPKGHCFLIATPGIHVSTPSIFQHPDLPRTTPKMRFDDVKFENTRNDCQTLVEKAHPKVANLLQWLLNYAPSRMTGTGASVFAVFASENEAKQALSDLPRKYQGFIANGTARSLLHHQLEQLDH